ncbi:MAG: fructose-1,6-bisphosphatase [Gemmiger sp.]|nr:fructose-1,6-bisphosphatase [Gemmiger sp.]
MDICTTLDPQQRRYLELLARQYPNRRAAYTEIINLQAILNLPKGTEHFISDLHGEYEAFRHILNNCSGVIRDKVRLLYDDTLSRQEQADLCTLIYYPREKLERIKKQNRADALWYRSTLNRLIELARFLSSKYSRSKVRKALPAEFGYILDELLHAQQDEDNNQQVYHAKILESIWETDSEDDFITALAALIKRLAVDHLHIVGDIYDRGAHADKIMDILMQYHSLDIEWGNHDILWMGAAAGSEACVAAVLRNNIRADNLQMLESGYGISLRTLAIFARKTYRKEAAISQEMKAISAILFKLEGQLLLRHPEYEMQDRLLLEKVDPATATVTLAGKRYPLCTGDFPTLDPAAPYRLTDEEAALVEDLTNAFQNSERLARHVRFLYAHGSMYRCYNQNLLFHGCIPLDADGNFDRVRCEGQSYQGRHYMDYADQLARRAYQQGDRESLDGIWYLWNGKKSPLCGRVVKTFERTYFTDPATYHEPRNPYYEFCTHEKTAAMILHEFGLYSGRSHIINGHTPVKAVKGESPIKANGKMLVIDGGFCRAYQPTTGLAGYTLIFNSHCMKIKQHRPFESVEKALDENADIESETHVFEEEPKRVMVGNTDTGLLLAAKIRDLQQLLSCYRGGLLQEH